MSIGDNVAGRLAGLSDATRRAYLSDLADLAQWCAAHGLDWEGGQVGSRHIFAYLLGLARDGRTQSTIRRRLTALRRVVASAPPPDGFGFDPSEFAQFERRILDASSEQASVLVVSDDAVIRAGLRAVLTEAGAVCWSESIDALDASIVSVWDYAIVWIRSGRGSDRYGAISRVGELSPDLTTAIPVVAVHAANVAPVVRLRLAEAGFRYLVPHNWLSGNLLRLADLLSSASIPIRYHLETPLALRESLGLRLSGELAELVAAAATLPPSVWRGERTLSGQELARADINRFRALALRSGGVPAPDFAKYATSMRRPPELPEWPRVRELLRQGLGYADTTDF